MRMAVLRHASVAFVFVGIIEEVCRCTAPAVMRHVWAVGFAIDENGGRSGKADWAACVLGDLELQLTSALESLEAWESGLGLEWGTWVH